MPAAPVGPAPYRAATALGFVGPIVSLAFAFAGGDSATDTLIKEGFKEVRSTHGWHSLRLCGAIARLHKGMRLLSRLRTIVNH